MRRAHALLIVTAAIAALSVAASAAPSGYHLLKSITIGGDGGFDYLNLDPDRGNLWVTRGDHVMVVDPDSGKLVSDITGLSGVHGTAFANGKAYVSEGGSGKVSIFDARTFQKTGEASAGQNPDSIMYDPGSNRIFTFNGRSNDATAIDVTTGKAMGSVALGGKPESASADGAGTIFVNIESKNEMVAFDARALAVKGHYPLAGCEAPTGQAMDVAHARIFSVCDGGVMTVTDSRNGKVVTTVKIGDGPDAARFDPASQLIFSSNGGDGTITIVHEDSPDKYTVLDNIATERGARTMEFDPRTRRVFTATNRMNPAPAPSANNPRPHATLVPGGFHIIVLGR
jgi:DNA-binding beta-propeller fold protein YncE